MSKSLNARISQWTNSGAKWAEVGLALALDAVETAHLNNGNIDPMKRIISACHAASDKADMLLIFSTYMPLTVTAEGEVSLKSGWAKKVTKEHHAYRQDAEGYKSFRALANKLRPVKEDKPAPDFDAAAYLASLERLAKKAHEGKVPADLLKQLDAVVATVKAAVGDNVVDHPAMKKAA